MIKRRGDFFGRAQEIKRIYARLNATPPGSVSVVGESKIGKSSLLNFIYMPQNRQEYLEFPDRMIMVFLDFQQEQSMTMDSFVRTLTGMASLELNGRLDVSDCSSGLDCIRSLIHRLDESGYRLAILMDGFESITRNPNFDLEFFSFLRFLANHFNVAYLTSSTRPLQILCHTQEIADSPFFNIFSTMRLGLFERADAEQLISIPSERVGNPLGAYSQDLIDLAGLFPVFLQMACSHAVEFLEEHPDRQLDLSMVRRRFYDEAIDYYEHVWESLTVEERKTIECLANEKKLPESKEYVVPELRRKSYIWEVDGKPMLFSDTFREFSLTKAAEHRTGFFRRFFGGSTG
jgi:hypothetical protein